VKNQGDCTAITELQDAWKQLTGKELPVVASLKDYSLVIGTEKSKLIQTLGLQKELQTLGNDGFIIRTMKSKGNKITVIASKGENGLLYAVFNLLRNIQLYVPSSNILRTIQLSSSPFTFDIKEVPSYKIRILNHWDNLDGTIERGYAGHSLWKWDELPGKLSPRYKNMLVPMLQ